MATTNGTEKELNYWGDKSHYSEYREIMTGNINHKEYKIVKNKYVSCNIFNNTYTLESDIENAILLNSIDPIYTWGDYFDSSLNRDWKYSLYGHPNKWIYDRKQQFNNCGVDSALNVLSIAGVKDIVEPSDEVMEELLKPKTITEKDAWGNETTRVIPSKIKFYPTENAFTLWAIQNNYCEHWKDVSDYKTTNDILFWDGGTHFTNINSEEHPYSDSIESINSMLIANGVESSTKKLHITQLVEGWEEPAYSDNCEEPENFNDGKLRVKHEPGKYIDLSTGAENDVTFSTYTIYGSNNTIDKGYGCDGNVSVENSDEGTDTIKFADLEKSDLNDIIYPFVKVNSDLYICYTDVYSVLIKNYFEKPGFFKIEDKNGMLIDPTIGLVDDTDSDYHIMDSNVRKYGSVLHKLADEIKSGKGVILEGDATQLNDSSANERDPKWHAITLVGVITQDLNHNDAENDNYEVSGFYIADTGGWVDCSEGAAFLNIEKLYNFLVVNKTKKIDATTNVPGNILVEDYIATKENIRLWADDLNIVGNKYRNTLYGNRGNNVLDGKKDSDVLYGFGGNDTLIGGDGNDTLYGGAGDNVLNGGAGDDTYRFNTTRVDLSYVLSTGYDIFEDAAGYYYVPAEACHDTIITGGGKDVLRFEDEYIENLNFINRNGDLYIEYNKSNPNPSSLLVKNYFNKDSYKSIYKIDDKESIAQRLGDNQDHSYRFLDVISASTIGYDGYVDKSVSNNIIGSRFKDLIETGEFADTIKAGDADDTIKAMEGNDYIDAGAGDDIIIAGHGNDKIYGGTGDNVIKYEQTIGIDDFSGYDTIYAGKGNDYIELVSRTRDDLTFTQKGNDLVVGYDTITGSSITISNYFSKKGNKSAKYILLNNAGADDYLDLLRENLSITKNMKISGSGTIVGGYAHDTLTGSSGNDTIYGYLGDDVIKAGAGSDSIIGGLNCDKLYGGGGSDTFIFETATDGIDTIYANKGDNITIKFTTDSGIILTDNNKIGGYKDYAYTKSGNNLVIDYAKTKKEEGMSTIVVADYFKQNTAKKYNTAYTIYDKNNSTMSLANATIYFKGNTTKKNKITGTAQNDYIVGGDLNDTIKAGNGHDTIEAGLGNDNITGGAGENTIIYKAGDGSDTVNLTKNEDLTIKATDYKSKDLSYTIDKKGNLLISADGSKILTLNKFGKKDVTGADGAVSLELNDATIDLRAANYLDAYTSFTKKKYKYTGNWHSETIDASGLEDATGKKDRGVVINAGAGNDYVVGSAFNDTIKGGEGNDTIIGGDGTNSLDGGNGEDIYLLFTSATDGLRKENTVIKDTGKTDSGTDTAIISKSIDIWFNIDKNGNYLDLKGKISDVPVFNVKTSGNTATITGVENIIAVRNISNTVQMYEYKYSDSALTETLASWISSHGYKDANDAFKYAPINDQKDFANLFLLDGNWQANTDGNDYIIATEAAETINGGKGDDTIYGKGGEDTIIGGDGNNEIYSGDDSDVITTTGDGNNKIYAGNGNNIIELGDITGGGDGDDYIATGNGDDSIFAGGGKNYITTTGGDNTITSGAGSDTICTGQGEGNDLIDAGDGDNSIVAYAGNNIITTGTGNDEIRVLDGNNTIDAGSGDNKIFAGNGRNEITVVGDGKDSIVTGNNTDFSNYTIIDAGDGDNSVITGNGLTSITSGAGNDTVITGDGNNIINAGDGVNEITTGNGNDNITTGYGDDLISAGTGNNTITSGNGNDSIICDNGDNIITAGNGNNYIYAVDGFNSITSGEGNDVIIIGNNNPDDAYTIEGAYGDTITIDSSTIEAGDGNNIINTGDGNFNITTGKNNDVITTGNGKIIINSGKGNDNLMLSKNNLSVIETADGNDTIDCGTGTAAINGGDGSDTYKIFYTIASTNIKITDTGDAGDFDIVEIGQLKSSLTVIFNVNKEKNGGNVVFDTSELTITTTEKPADGACKVIVSGIEQIKTQDNSQYKITACASIAEEVCTWLNSDDRTYTDVNSVFETGSDTEIQSLTAIFHRDSAWEPIA